MSFNREYQTKINDEASLVEALKQKGFSPEVHVSPVALIGYHGDKRKNTAEIVIPRKQIGASSNDIGFKKQTDGSFLAIVSDFDKTCGYNDVWLKDLVGRATEAKAMKVIKKLNLKQVNRVEVGGKVRLQFTLKG